jgi:phage terminase large subunit
VLGTELWDGQIRIVNSVLEHRNTAVRSGHKVGKSTALACVALWFFCTFPAARVVLTAVTASQVDEVMWRELKFLYQQSLIGKHPIDGLCGERARTGMNSHDGRQILGRTARRGEALAGISGANVLICVDEASGVNDEFFTVLDSSLAGSGGFVRKCYISNPTRTIGEFYRAFTTSADLFSRIHISSEDTPNARGTGVIPGLAGPEWIAERKREHGEDSALYAVRVRGDFVHGRDGRVVSSELIASAREAWDAGGETDQGPHLQIGVDPAGDGPGGDETAIVVRRGMRILNVLGWRSLTEAGIASEAIGVLREYAREGDAMPRLCVDATGGIGARVAGYLRAHLNVEANANDYALIEVYAHEKLYGDSEYARTRDGLWGHLRAWLRAGGQLPADIRLIQDINTPSFELDLQERCVATSKKQMRKILSRSPDRGDAACLATWRWEDAPRPSNALTDARKAASGAHSHAIYSDIQEAISETYDPYGGAG